MRRPGLPLIPVVCAVATLAWLSLSGKEPSRTGPATEKRFPPLKIPPGFKATLFACDPLIEYPSVIAAGPRPGTLFVAIDYMTGLGTDIVRRSEIRLIEDTDGDGYADKATVFADGFNSIQGLAFHGGTVWVMHAPFLTALRDTNGDGKADERRDLLTGLGLTPEKNPVRLHCANGVVRGHDGWLYLALGDHGCDVKRPEGDRLVLNGGGILRCRPDGHDLHVFATGLRNIYDVALDAELNVFVRDNENDGGDYKIRVCHSFFGADHGYPYLYYERPDEALPPLADLGLGSSAGGVCYLERGFPTEYRGSLFFCEWGRSVVCYHPRRSGSGFAPLKEQEFARGADNDSYGFKPTDLVVDHDGALFVSDWADDQRPKRGRGRIYRITQPPDPYPIPPPSAPGASDTERWLYRLEHGGYHWRTEAQDAIERQGRKGTRAVREALSEKKLSGSGRLHAVWILAHVGGKDAIDELVKIVQHDPDVSVQAQAVRAVADLADPVLALHRLDAPRGDTKLAERLAACVEGKEARVLLEVVVALGRLRWVDAPAWLQKILNKPDDPLAHAAMQTLRRCDNWPAVLKLADRPDTDPLRAIAVRALADQFVPEVVDGLIERLGRERASARRRQYADALTRVCKRSGEWVYWGYRPPPRSANTVSWERTSAIEKALDGALGDRDLAVRFAVLRRMQREKIPARLATLGRWLHEEANADRLTALVDALREHPAGATRAMLATVIGERKKPAAGRLAALGLFTAGLDEASEPRLLTLARSLEEGPVLAATLRQFGKHPRLKTSRLLLDKLGSSEPAVRAAAIEALAALQVPEAAEPVRQLLVDRGPSVRRAAASAAGRLKVRSATTALLGLARDADADTRRASLESLRLLKEPRAVPLAVAALSDETTRHAALQCIADLGGPAQAEAVVDLARRDPSAEVLPLVLRLLADWSSRPGAVQADLERAAADLQGSSGVLARWYLTGPLSPTVASRLVERLSSKPLAEPRGEAPRWRTIFGSGTEARLRPGPSAEEGVWLASSDLRLPEQTRVQFLSGGSPSLRLWVNGKLAYRRDEVRPFRADAEHFDAVLEKGLNRVIIQIGAAKGGSDFHARFRRKSSTAEHEALTRAALTRPGNPEHGRKLFFDAAKTQCVKCHRIGDQGERIGPELTGLGSRFPRIHLIESILQPSRTIAPGYQTFAVTLKGGRVLTGVRIAEADDTLTLADTQANKHVLRKSSIEDQQPQAVSVMPEGLEKPLSVDEFVDLIAFLSSLKGDRPR
jgi:putative membrane-bound dehydrogenase-like protein